MDASKLTATVPSAQLSLTDSDIPGLFTTKITGGIFDIAHIPALPASQITSGTFATTNIPDLDATKITTGVFASADRIPMLTTAKIDPSTTFGKTMITTDGTWPVSDIPTLNDANIADLDASKLTGTVASARLSLVHGDIPALDSSKITTGTLGVDRIPSLPTTKITQGDITLDAIDCTTLASGYLSIASNSITGYQSNLTINAYDGSITCKGIDTQNSDISLGTGKITASLASSQFIRGDGFSISSAGDWVHVGTSSNSIDVGGGYVYTDSSGYISGGDIRGSSYSEATGATNGLIGLNADSNTNDFSRVLDCRVVNSTSVQSTTVSTSWTVIHTDLRSNAVAKVPPSCVIECELSFYLDGLYNGAQCLGRLVVGGTSDEFVEEVIHAEDVDLCVSTEGTFLKEGGNYPPDHQVTGRWTLRFPTTMRGDTINIEPQLQCSSSYSFTVKTGRSSSSVCYPSFVFKVSSLPTNAFGMTLVSGG